jgi:hypothetical protein
VGTDVFEHAGKTYLLAADFYSKYLDIELLRQRGATSLPFQKPERVFTRCRVPEQVIMDLNTVIHAICLILVTNLNNLLRNGDFSMLLARQSMLIQMVELRELYKLPK